MVKFLDFFETRKLEIMSKDSCENYTLNTVNSKYEVHRNLYNAVMIFEYPCDSLHGILQPLQWVNSSFLCSKTLKKMLRLLRRAFSMELNYKMHIYSRL